jgi:hypothetical protein
MKTFIEFRIQEKYAREFIPEDVGIRLGNIRKVRVSTTSEIYPQILMKSEFVWNKYKDFLFFGWNIQRQYSKDELFSAELLLINDIRTFEPAGSECGTKYDFASSCLVCGFGIKQVSNLILRDNSIPKNTDIARSISNEIIVSEIFSNQITQEKCTGFIFSPVDNISRNKVKGGWNQLESTSYVDISPDTKTGNTPFDPDFQNDYRCKYGHTIGLNRLSELFIIRKSWDGSDFVKTKQLLGVKRGLLRTYPLFCVSQKVFSLIREHKYRGFNFEIVRFV